MHAFDIPLCPSAYTIMSAGELSSSMCSHNWLCFEETSHNKFCLCRKGITGLEFDSKVNDDVFLHLEILI